ncbi:hypothetical protein [Cronobacter sakazakii]|nr:hypothetical protein [Cronobacter sakazakii]
MTETAHTEETGAAPVEPENGVDTSPDASASTRKPEAASTVSDKS